MARAVQLTSAVLMNVQVCKVQWATKGLPVLRDSQGKLGTQALRGRAAQDDRCSQGGGGQEIRGRRQWQTMASFALFLRTQLVSNESAFACIVPTRSGRTCVGETGQAPKFEDSRAKNFRPHLKG